MKGQRRKNYIFGVAPFDCPDPLLKDRTLTIEAGNSQPVWLTVHVPKATPGGLYRGKAGVETSAGNVDIPIELVVYPFELPDERHLYLTNWLGNHPKFLVVASGKMYAALDPCDQLAGVR